MSEIKSDQITLNNGKNLVFKTIHPYDAISFLEFRKQIPYESTHTYQYVGMEFPSVEETSKRLEAQLNDKFILNIGVFDENKIVGYLNFRLFMPEHPWVTHLGQFGMMILKNYWGLGIGKYLLAMLDKHALSVGVRRIEANVRVLNDRGVALYKYAGYKIEGTRKLAAQINGEFYDEFHIAKIFDDSMAKVRPPSLETSRLILRPIEISDAQSIFDYAKNPNVSKYTLWEKHETVADSLNYIKDYIFSYYAEGVPEPLGITLKSNPSKVIGTVGCFWTSKSAKAMELAYALSEGYWGKGIVAEASEAVMNYCFKEFSLKRIQARCKTENTNSVRVMEKIGMSYEGTLRSAIFHRNKYSDMHYYAKVM